MYQKSNSLEEIILCLGRGGEGQHIAVESYDIKTAVLNKSLVCSNGISPILLQTVKKADRETSKSD